MAEHTEQLDSNKPEFPEDMRLFRIAIWSGTLSWLVLILGLLDAGFDFYQYVFNGVFSSASFEYSSVKALFSFLTLLSPLLRPIMLWFFLQALKEFLFLMIDIKENLNSQTIEE